MEKHFEKGYVTKEELITLIKSGKVKYVTICIPSLCNNFTKRYEAHYFLKSILEQGIKFPELVFNLNYESSILMTKNLNYESTNDIKVKIDTNCIRRMSWLGSNHIICMTDCIDLKNRPNKYSPRSILKKLLSEAEEKGFFFVGATELEYYVFNKKNDEIIKNNPEINLKKFTLNNRKGDYCMPNFMDRYEDFNEEVKDNIVNAGIQLEGLFSEYGPGQHEVNIKYNEILKNCDNHILLKRCIKHTLYKKGMGCTFMAKPLMNVSGCSCHVHLSLLDKNKKNLFLPSKNQKENYEINSMKHGKISVHKNFYYFIGGILKYIKQLFICYAPTINSYKRFRPYSHCPYYINTWLYDSKTGGLRVLGEGQNLRLEIRIAGADANPYILLTSIIASGLKGIENKIIPPDEIVGDVYKGKGEEFVKAPANILEASRFFEDSEFAKDVFGEELKEFIVKQGKKQWEDYDNFVTAFEVNKYLDQV